MALKMGGIPWMEAEKKAISEKDSFGLAAWNKLDGLGHIDRYQGYIGFDGKRPDHTSVIRAFRDAARNIAHCEIMPITVGISDRPPAHMKNDPVGFEFAITSDVTAAQGKDILSAVRQKTGASLFIR